MADENKYSSDFSKQSDSYIKFLIYHLAIIITIVFSLYSAVKKLEDEDVAKKVAEINSLRAITNTIPLDAIHDNIIKGMYFEKAPCDSSRSMLLDLRNSLTAHKTGDIATDSLNKIKSDSIAKMIVAIDTAIAKQRTLLKEIEKTSSNAFQLRLTFLGDAQLDLRIWVFFLPFVFLLSCIYIFILDQKISILKRQATALGTPVTVDFQYPFSFLRSLLLFAEIFLVGLYIYIIIIFFNVQDSSLKNYVLYAVLFFIYYGLVYALYFSERIRAGTGEEITKFYLFRKLAVVWKKKVSILSKLNPFAYLGLGQVFLVATLFLVMTYSGCDERSDFHRDDLKKGYQLIIEPHVQFDLFAENYNDPQNSCDPARVNLYTAHMDSLPVILSTFGAVLNKYFYIVLVLTVLITFSWYRRRKKKILFRISSFFIVMSVFVFTFYFGFYHLFKFPAYSFPVSLLGMLYWYFSFYKRNNDPAFFGINHLKGLVIFLLPLMVLSLINTVRIYHHREGWIFLFLALWFLLLAVIFLQDPEKAVIDQFAGAESITS